MCYFTGKTRNGVNNGAMVEKKLQEGRSTVNCKQLTTKTINNSNFERFSYSDPHAVNIKNNFFNYSNDHRHSNCNKCVVISESVPLLWKIH